MTPARAANVFKCGISKSSHPPCEMLSILLYVEDVDAAITSCTLYRYKLSRNR